MDRELYNCAAGCPVQNTVDLISGKWKSVILYHLFKGDATRFSTLTGAWGWEGSPSKAEQGHSFSDSAHVGVTIIAT